MIKISLKIIKENKMDIAKENYLKLLKKIKNSDIIYLIRKDINLNDFEERIKSCQ